MSAKITYVVCGDEGVMRDNARTGSNVAHHGGHHVDLSFSDRAVEGYGLPVDVAFLHRIAIDEHKRPHARARQSLDAA